MNSPKRAVVFSFDEKTQCQAMDRTQPSLPMVPGRAGTMTHDYSATAPSSSISGSEAKEDAPEQELWLPQQESPPQHAGGHGLVRGVDVESHQRDGDGLESTAERQ